MNVNSSNLRKDLYDHVRKHKLGEKCKKHEHEVVKHIMESISEYQRQHVKPKNWWNDINNVTDTYEKQERYHEYILRKTREENTKNE